MNNNPLLNLKTLPQFSEIKPEQIEPALDLILKENRAAIAELQNQADFSWDNLIQPLEDMDVRLGKMWSVVSHLNSVVSNDALREAYNKVIPEITQYSTEQGQNRKLYEAFQQIADSAQFNELQQYQKKVIKDALRDFKLSGISLSDDKKKQFSELQQQSAVAAAKFSENVLDATDAWSKHLSDEKMLAGIPQHAISSFKNAAKEKKLDGWLINLEFPSYQAVITFADNRELRQEIYTAFSTRASDQGPHAGKWDNSQLMAELLKLRHQEAQLLDFNDYTELSLATKMAKNPQQVTDFLAELAQRSKPMAEKEWQTLQAFGKENFGLNQLQAWDVAYTSEKLRQQKYAFSDEELRPYFPVDHVLKGLFTVVERLYGIKVVEKLEGFEKWHDEVHFFELFDKQDQLKAGFYADLYSRPHKRSGAWMDSCTDRHRGGNNELELPIAMLICNFTSPTDDTPALLTHEEVTTLFHEFGHSLHHMLTKLEFASVSGINGVSWDAVELPSQFMENWCWQKESLDLVACHYKTKEPLPDELFKKLVAAKNFQTGMAMVRQLEFSLFDFRIHQEYDESKGDQIQTILDEVRAQMSVVPVAEFNRFQHGFSHIFAGGYAAGYYGYKWAEVLSSDAFTQFEQNGFFDQATGQRFLTSILEQGSSREAMELFVDFQGREPKVDALLRHCGIE